jgi:hypothetical protein
LGLLFGAVIAVGGITELRRVAHERAALLATERERVRRLSELTALKADLRGYLTPPSLHISWGGEGP